MSEIFRRVEKKYILNEYQYNMLKDRLKEYMCEDKFGKSTICNIYFDSNLYELISHSITKPYYKEKVRLRSYNTPNSDSTVYLEIKRKYDGIVGKRRIPMKLSEFDKYLRNKNKVRPENKQIKTELDYYFDKYNLKPAMYISYAREAYFQKDDMNFRVTFDSKVIAREYDLKLDTKNYGTQILDTGKYIMEIKTLDSIPLWFIRILNDLQIIPGSFSKYGEAYSKLILKTDECQKCVV